MWGLLAALLIVIGVHSAQAQSCAPANYKTLSQIMSEFQTCVAQGFGSGCITVTNFQDLICSERKLTSGDFVTVSPSGGTFTPDFNAGVNFSIALSSSCPCVLANPSNQANQSGLLEIIQDSTGSRTIQTYGTNYLASSEPTLSTAANAKDYVAYSVNPAGKIVFGSPVLNAH
jgi:hypothetical protein